VTRPKLGRYPVSSFGPELMALLIKASRERVEVPCQSMAQMKALQQRIHNLRGAMNRERHPQYVIATRVHTSCTWDHDAFPVTKKRQFPKDATGCKLVLYPRDSQFAGILEAAGIKAEDVQAVDDLLAPEAPVPSTPPDPTTQPAEPSDDPIVNEDSIYGRFK
jgi:hypothetical protein